ncbi:MAG: right-handed parallel beta-helix repeat-containing protein [Azospirillaceae bacterium]
MDVDLNGSVFLPVWQNETQMVYVDIRGQARNDDATAELGIAYREMVDENMIVGVGAHYQLHNSQFQNTFERFVIEGEVMTLEWDARLRGYIPLTSDDEEFVPELSELVNVGSTPRVLPGLEAPMYGIDGEIGRRFWVSEDGSEEVRAFAGGFYFAHPDYDNSLAGPEGRVEYRIYDPEWLTPGSRMEFMVEGSWDDVREDQWRGLVTMQIPLQAIYSTSDGEMGPPTGLSRRMLDVAPRDTFTTQTRLGVAGRDDLPAFFADGTPIEQLIFVDEGGSGDMSGLSPENAANDADFNLFAGDPNTLIVALGQNGLITTDNMSYEITGQHVFVLGGGSDAFIATPDFNFNYTAPGTRPTFNVFDVNVHTNETSVIDITGNNVTLQGVSLTGGFNGVHAVGASNLTLRDIIFSDALATINNAGLVGDDLSIADGIFIDGGDNIVIDGYVYNGGPNNVGGNREGDALDVRNASNVTINNVTISDVNRTGILLGGVTGFSISNVTITNAEDGFVGPDAGIYGTATALGIGIFNSDGGALGGGITNLTINGVGQTVGTTSDAVVLSATDNVTISNFSIANVGRNGIAIIGDSDGIAIMNGTISNTSFKTTEDKTGGISIRGFGNASDITISSVTVTDSAKDGIRIDGATDVMLNDITVMDISGFNGFNIVSSDQVTISNFTVDNVGLSGVNLFDTTNVTVSNGTISNFENLANASDFGGVRIQGGDNIALADLVIANQGANSSNGIVFNATGAGTIGISMTNIAISGVDFGLRFRGGGAVTYDFAPGSNATVASNTLDTCLAVAPNITGDLTVNGAPIGAPPACP